MIAGQHDTAKMPKTAVERGYVLHPVPPRRVSAMTMAALAEWRARHKTTEPFEFQHQGRCYRVHSVSAAFLDFHRLQLAQMNVDGKWTPCGPIEVLEYGFGNTVIPATVAEVRRGLNESVALADPVEPGFQLLVVSPLEWPASQEGDDE